VHRTDDELISQTKDASNVRSRPVRSLIPPYRL
jgi:hypothetical protein